MLTVLAIPTVRGVAQAMFLLAMLVPVAQAMPGGGRLGPRDDLRQNFAPPQQASFRDAQQQYPRRESGDMGEAQRPQRLSPEERRQLRRDVHEAGRDIYRPRQ